MSKIKDVKSVKRIISLTIFIYSKTKQALLVLFVTMDAICINVAEESDLSLRYLVPRLIKHFVSRNVIFIVSYLLHELNYNLTST